jgi:hypothetical protein
MTALQTLLRSRITGKPSPKGWVSFNCPMCVVNGQSRNDTKRRGGIMFNPDGAVSYHCFNCDYKTSWSPGRTLSFKMRKLLKQLGFDEAEVQRLNLELLSQADVENLIQREPEPVWTPNWPAFNFNFDLAPLSDPAKIEYLQNRQIYDLAVWLETKTQYAGLNNRVILPMTYDDKIVGFQSRHVIGELPSKFSKYYKKVPADYVYGLDRQKDGRQYVIVTEGEFDALLTNGLSVGSNNISDRQIQLIEDLNIEPILLPDADSSGRQLVERAADFGWSVSFPEWENCKDVGDAVLKYGRLFAVYSILQAAEHSPTKIRLLGKRYCQ